MVKGLRRGANLPVLSTMRSWISRPALLAIILCALALVAAPRTASTAPSKEVAASASVPVAGTNAAGVERNFVDADIPPADLQMGDVHFDVRLQTFADTYVGLTHFDTLTVQIDPASGAGLRREVYLHELMHVAWHQGKPSADKNHKFTEEEAIRALTPGLLKMLQENPEAVKYLQK